MVSKEYLSFSKRERTGIITLVFLLIVVAVVPKFVCHPKPVAEKLPEKQLQQLADQKPGYYPERKYHKLDTVYVRKYLPGNYTARKFKPFKKFESNYSYTPKLRLQPIDINTADTTAFIALPGIGSKLANRIVSFRTKLGGFTAVEQIKQVYGLQDSVYQRILPLLTLKLSG